MRSRTSPPVALVAIPLVAFALFASAGCKKQLAQFREMIAVPGRCPDAVPDQATGTESPRDALGCFKKAVDDKNGEQFLRVTCRGKSAAGCKQPPGAEKEAAGIISELEKKDLGGIVASWDDGPKTKVYAVEQRANDKKVSVVSVCQIAIENRWAVCAVEESSREAAEKRDKR